MIGDGIRDIYHQTKWALVLRGVLSVIVGVFILSRPIASVAAFALVIALWAIFDGVVNIVRSFNIRGIVSHWWVLLLTGIVSVLFGATALYYFPDLSLAFAVLWTAYWLVLSGVMAVFASFQERSVGLSWGWTMAFGVIAIIGGVYAFMSPGATLLTLVTLYATFAIVSGVFLLIAAARMGSLQRTIDRAVPMAARA
jgi:uncharacterized membrane protein HdeD (DUF308 family)